MINLDVLTYAACPDNVASTAVLPKYAFVEAHIRGRATLSRVFVDHKPNEVTHLAAESHVDRSIGGLGAFFRHQHRQHLHIA